MTQNHVEEKLRAGVIEPANSEFESPLEFATRKDVKLRFCVDYRRFNLATVSNTYHLPGLDDCIDSLGDATVLTTLDPNCMYWKIPIRKEDRKKTSFTTHGGTYRYKRMPFGFRNAPVTFQRVLDIIISGIC